MRTEPVFPTVNHAVIVGVLEINQRGRNRRSAMRGTVTEASIQVLTPFGEPFAIALTLPGVIENGYKLTNGKTVAVEGQVRMERGFDRRYADEDNARGLQTRAMQFVVTRVRDAEADEPFGSSFVQLVGSVLDPPQFVAHPQFPGVRLALVPLGITQERPAPYPGSSIVRQERSQVTVAVPIDHSQAGLLYRPDNRVQIQGELDCVLVERAGRTDTETAAIRRVREQWAETEQQIRADAQLLRENPRAEAQAYGRYLGQLRRFADTPSWRVLAGHIEPLDNAEPITRSQAQRLRERWASERNRDRQSNEAPTLHEDSSIPVVPKHRPRRTLITPGQIQPSIDEGTSEDE